MSEELKKQLNTDVSEVIDQENLYFNDKQEVINEINRIVNEKLTIRFTEIYLELNKIKNDIDQKHESTKKSTNVIIDSLKNEILTEIKTFVTDHIKTFFELFSSSSKESPTQKKKSFFSCSSMKK